MTVSAEPAAAADELIVVPVDGFKDNQLDQLAGDSAKGSGDVAFSVLGGMDGLQVIRAASSNDYKWEHFISIPVPEIETDQWTSAYCLTSSGTRMVVVYAPRTFANDEALMLGGAWAAVVDLERGSVTDLGQGFTMAYFNPGCGGGEFVALTRYPGDGTTQLAVIDAAKAEVVNKMTVDTQVYSAVATTDGDLLAVTEDGIARLAESGRHELIVSTPGVAYDLRVLDDQVIYVVREGVDRARILSSSIDRPEARPRVIAEGPLTELSVAVREDAIYVLGEAKILDAGSDVVHVEGAALRAKISSEGLFAVGPSVPSGVGSDGLGPEYELSARVETVAVSSETDVWFLLESDNPMVLVSDLADGTEVPEGGGNSAPSGSVPASGLASLGSPTDPIETERACAIPRNDPNNQAYQPKPRQVEWAVDRAVMGQLTESRPSNWRNLGMAAYTPQGMFPRVTLSGGGTIPPQIVLGVLAQESNLWQASRFTAPGNTGNPLMGGYYGNRTVIWSINYAAADCGYGVGQITDGMRITDTSLTSAEQRAIALDYAANVAMAVRMLGQKWNQVRAAGMQINNGSAGYIENWFYAVWAYNSGFYEEGAPGEPWGVGWNNNPANSIYPANRGAFLDDSPSDAAHPSDWPYPEKVLGFAAHSVALVETQVADVASRTYPQLSVVAGFRTAWWNGDGSVGDERRYNVKPPVDLFCTMSDNDCNMTVAQPCQRADFKCWFNDDAAWKDCSIECGYGFERFPSSYATEVSSMPSSLPANTLKPSFSPNCASGAGYSAPPSGALIVDDTTHAPVRSDCTHQARTGSFGFQFYTPDGNGNYVGKIDLHQLGGGYNAHFYFTHMRKTDDNVDNINNRLKITGTWNLGQQLHQWVRIWVHLPDHAAWTDQAGYTINLGNGQSQTRYIPQRRYQNSWVSLGVFYVDGTPTVSLSNITVPPGGNENYDDVAWDAVAFQPLAAKPTDFVVALGDSYGSGEGAGSYAAWSDHGGRSAGAIERNACHQSADAWIRQATIPGRSASIGVLADSANAAMDFQFLACSGAESEHLLPFHTVTGSPPENGEGETGQDGMYNMVSQLDAGFLDANTTLVTVSIGGNDMRFAPILKNCAIVAFALSVLDPCSDWTLEGDSLHAYEASLERLEEELPNSIRAIVDTIQLKAPDADIVLMSYPHLFDAGGSCIFMNDTAWLNEIAVGITTELDVVAGEFDTSSDRVLLVDPQPYFEGHAVCDDATGFNRFVVPLTPGDLPRGLWEGTSPFSAETLHPGVLGNSLYADALEVALGEIYP